jgi:hypothetical protein
MLGDVAFILLSGGCVVLAYVSLRKMGWGGKFGVVNLGLFAGMVCVFLGDVTGGIYDILLKVTTPFPSVADGLYLIGYMIVSVAALQFLWFFRAAVRKVALKLIFLFGVFIVILSIVLVESNVVTSVPFVALEVAYPVYDSFLFLLSIILLLLFRDGLISPPWRWLAFGMLLVGVAHFLNGVGSIEGWYSFPQPIDLFYLWGYISFGLGFSMQPGLRH